MQELAAKLDNAVALLRESTSAANGIGAAAPASHQAAATLPAAAKEFKQASLAASMAGEQDTRPHEAVDVVAH